MYIYSVLEDIKRIMKKNNKYNKKSTSLHCNDAGGCRYSLLTIVWTVVGFFLVAHLISLYSRKDNNIHQQVSSDQLQVVHHLAHPIVRELIRVEEEVLRMPPPRKRSPRTSKRRSRKPIPLVEEFLDDKSPIRHLFFPGIKTAAFGPTKDMGNETSYYFPGKIWMDTQGNPIQAHGGGILLDVKSNTYYWYGEYKDGPTYHAHKKGPARVSSTLFPLSSDVWSFVCILGFNFRSCLVFRLILLVLVVTLQRTYGHGKMKALYSELRKQTRPMICINPMFLNDPK